MDVLIKSLMELIANTVDAHTVCFFERKDDYLNLSHYFSLSSNLNKNKKFKIDESFIGWIAKHKKPVNIKGDEREYKVLKIYQKNEDIKSYYILPVGREGVLYIDSKRMYSITEKYQKLLHNFSKFLETILKYKNEFSILKSRLKLLEYIKKIDFENFLDYLCKIFHFEWGMVFKREGDEFKILKTNYNGMISGSFKLNDSRLGVILKKNIKRINFFSKGEDFFPDSTNFLYIPFFKNNILVGAIFLINFDFSQDVENVLMECNYFYQILQILFYNLIFKLEVKKGFEIETTSDFYTEVYFFRNIEKFKEYKSFFLFKNNSITKLIKKYDAVKILYSYKKLKNTIERVTSTEFTPVLINLNLFILALKNKIGIKEKNLIEKNFKNTYLKINNRDENVIFKITFFENVSKLINSIYSQE